MTRRLLKANRKTPQRYCFLVFFPFPFIPPCLLVPSSLEGAKAKTTSVVTSSFHLTSGDKQQTARWRRRYTGFLQINKTKPIRIFISKHPKRKPESITTQTLSNYVTPSSLRWVNKQSVRNYAVRTIRRSTWTRTVLIQQMHGYIDKVSCSASIDQIEKKK